MLARRLALAYNNKASTQRFAADYNASAKCHSFNLLDAVGVRVPGKNARSGDGTNRLPGLVIGIHQMDRDSTAQLAVHQLYTVWCPSGVLTDKFSVDKLNKLKLNSYPELVQFKEHTLTDSERLPSDDPNWRSPLAGTATNYDRITVATAWAAHRQSYTQRTVDQSRNRTTASRATAAAADTAIAATQADSRSALSLATVTNQPASQPVRSSSPSRIVQILSMSKTNVPCEVQPAGRQPGSADGVTYLAG